MNEQTYEVTVGGKVVGAGLTFAEAKANAGTHTDAKAKGCKSYEGTTIVVSPEKPDAARHREIQFNDAIQRIQRAQEQNQ